MAGAIEEYEAFIQDQVLRPGPYPASGIDYLALQLCSEAGEVAGEVAKSKRPGSPDRSFNVLHELGDALYYVVRIAMDYGYTMQDIIDANESKLYALMNQDGRMKECCIE